ncbi:hypothetical protein ACFP2T_23200 [Plantactinospora solaniradicis]|uniref:DUF2567 domain-containing protein n=1 Tax=Plantactinospora solaniradicis TaxID=1723736 RepID=A0ABW1KBS0_9ACTN
MTSWGASMPDRGTRPRVVIVSTALLLVVAVAQSVSVILAEREYRAYRSAYDAMHPGTDGFVGFVSIARGVLLLFGLAFAVALVVLAVVNLHGKRAARVFTWVLGGPLVLWTAAGLVRDVVFAGGPTAESRELSRLAHLELPGWHDPVALASGVAVPLLLLAALLLLALPAASAFVRARATGDPDSPPVPEPTPAIVAPSDPGGTPGQTIF